MFARVGLITGLLVTLAAPALAQQRPDGAGVFKQSCASCHGENQTTAPTPAVLRQMTPESILNSLTLGRMQIQAISLSEAEQRAVSEFLAGKPFGPPTPPVVVNRCATTTPMRAPAATGE
jgi:mono/diheme cytochrome c family protein